MSKVIEKYKQQLEILKRELVAAIEKVEEMKAEIEFLENSINQVNL